MSAKVEILIQVCVNGRPLWRKSKVIRPEMSLRMDDREYAAVVDAASRELAMQVKNAEAKMEKATVK
jgi:hypothetical protein